MRKLEERFPDDLVVVGVHSPKFPAEKETKGVRDAVLRYEIEHPVVSDPGMRTWSEYAVRAWPTLMFVDPAGKLVGKHEGEIRFEEAEPLVGGMLDECRAKGLLGGGPLEFQPEPPLETTLLFPGKVLADEESGRLFVADSGHHRVLVATLDGRVERVIGSGERGLRDGDAGQAAFDKPQGMALHGNHLYVADSWNHAIRRVELATGRVDTVAGNGEQARRVIQEGPAAGNPLNSPWDLAIRGDVLYIAMAGTHQLWSLDLARMELARFAGTGREALADGPRGKAAFAQPSGLASDGERLYVADSETSAVRAVELPGSGDQARTLVGRGLFDFGDRDGQGDEVRLQHAIGVAHDPATGSLYLADSYNNRIKRMDPATRRVVSMLGSGRAEWADGEGPEASFSEPGGLSVGGGKLYVADTNNQAIRVADLTTLQVSTLELTGLP